MSEHLEPIEDFFAAPPVNHTISVGSLVACTCHTDGIAIVIDVYDDARDAGAPMNMAKIYWIRRPKGYNSRIWMHTIARLKEYKLNKITDT